MTVVYLVAGALLLAAAVLTLVRAERGPTMLDRTVALDVFATVLVGGIALEAAWSQRVDVLPILVALSLVGFVGSTTIARFASVEPGAERRIRTIDEVAAEDARLQAEEDAAYEEARRTREIAAAAKEAADSSESEDDDAAAVNAGQEQGADREEGR